MDDVATLRAFTAARIASYKVPKAIRLRKQVLAPERQLAAFDLENTLIASNVVAYKAAVDLAEAKGLAEKAASMKALDGVEGPFAQLRVGGQPEVVVGGQQQVRNPVDPHLGADRRSGGEVSSRERVVDDDLPDLQRPDDRGVIARHHPQLGVLLQLGALPQREALPATVPAPF